MGRGDVKKVVFLCLSLLFMISQFGIEAHAKTVAKKHDSRSQFTAKEREKLAAKFRELCKKKYGAPSQLIKIEYDKRQYICSEPGY